MTGNDIQARLREATVKALNRAAEDLMVAAQAQTPGGGDNALRDSARVNPATVEFLLSEVSFNAPYAAAQEVGHAKQHWTTGKPERYWEVKNRPGGGTTGYLEGAVKALIPKFESYFYEEWRKVLNG